MSNNKGECFIKKTAKRLQRVFTESSKSAQPPPLSPTKLKTRAEKRALKILTSSQVDISQQGLSATEKLRDEMKYLLATSLIADFRKYCSHSVDLQLINIKFNEQVDVILKDHESTRNQYVSRLPAWIKLEQAYEEYDRNETPYNMSHRLDYENKRKTYLNAVLAEEKKFYEVQYNFIKEAIEATKLHNTTTANTYRSLNHPLPLAQQQEQHKILSSGTLPDRGLRLRNGGSDCFIICVVNMLATVDWLFERLSSRQQQQQQPKITELEKYLADLFTRQTSSPMSLRLALENAHPTTRLAQGQQDAKEAMSLLNEALHLPREEAVLMREITTCSQCKFTSNLPKEPFWGANLQLRRPMALNAAVKEVIKVPTIKFCPSCGAHLANEATRYEVNSIGSYFWIAINIDSSNGKEYGLTSKDQYLDNVGVRYVTKMLGVYWEPVALVEYRPDAQTRWSDAGNYGQSGHYVTWLNKWGVGRCCIDDDRYLAVGMPEKASVMNNVVLIMFKRK